MKNVLALAVLLSLVLAGCEQGSATVAPKQPDSSADGTEPPALGADEEPWLPGTPAPPFPIQGHTVDEGRALALEHNCPLVLVYEHPGCHRCELFNQRHLNNKKLRAVLSRCAVVIKNIDRSDDARYEIDTTPTILLYANDQGTLRFADVIAGLQPEEVVTIRVSDILKGRNHCEEALAEKAAGDEDAYFVLGNSFLPFLDPDQRQRFLH